MGKGNGFKETVDSLFQGIDGFFAAKSVVGEPIHVGNTIIVPLADVSFGVGAGSFGGENKENDGGGVGGKMTPCAVLIIQGGKTRLVNIRNQDSLAKVIDLVPDIVDRLTPDRDDVTVETPVSEDEEQEKKD